tara:strand:- start:1187 stop:2053 length:867 start_codon:yes stop_codon:yes gene_type:complete
MLAEIKVPIEKLRKRSIFFATPMYGGQCSGMFARSIADLSTLCTHYGIKIKFYFLFNESLITRARNYCADEFLRSDCSHLMFVDSDIGFNANDVIALLALQSQNPEDDDYDILAGPYPKKSISWEKIMDAVNKGYGEENPNELENFVGDYVFNPAHGTKSIKLDAPAEVLEAGTGFMMIRRNTFEKFAEAYPQQLYNPDHVRTEHFDGSRQIMAYFDTPICEDSNRYLSEDYMFCQWSRKAGMKVWFCPWMEMKHVGMYVFGGSLKALADLGASPTADLNKIKKPNKG